MTDTFAFLDASLAYAANSVTVTLKRNDIALPAVANTPNQRAAASGVNSLGGGNTIYGAILGLSATEARTAFDLLSGEIHASVATALVEDSRFVRETANQRMLGIHRSAIDASRAVWTQAYGSYGTWSTDGNAATVTRATGGSSSGVTVRRSTTALPVSSRDTAVAVLMRLRVAPAQPSTVITWAHTVARPGAILESGWSAPTASTTFQPRVLQPLLVFPTR